MPLPGVEDADELAGMFDPDEFGLVATFTRPDGTTFDAAAQFDRAHDVQQVEDSRVTRSRPELLCQASEIAGVVEGYTVSVDSRSFLVIDVQDDETGLARLVLQQTSSRLADIRTLFASEGEDAVLVRLEDAPLPDPSKRWAPAPPIERRIDIRAAWTVLEEDAGEALVYRGAQRVLIDATKVDTPPALRDRIERLARGRGIWSILVVKTIGPGDAVLYYDCAVVQ